REDKFLCRVYLEISQDPIIGAYQTSDHFCWSGRSKRSLQSRIQTIEKATKKLHACIKQCENQRPSGASNDNIFNQAKSMLSEDSRFKTGWKFDHVWSIIKDFEKFKDGAPAKRISVSIPENTCSESENHFLDSPRQISPGLSSFSLNLSDGEGNISGSPSPRPSGIKKSKMKRKLVDQTTTVIDTLKEGNKQFLEQLKKSSTQRECHLDIQKKNYALNELKEENKYLFYDLSSEEDPDVRAYIQEERTRILQKQRGQQHEQEAPSPSTSFEQYFNNLGGNGSNLSEY
ncbi:hypothetical protein N665_0784s0002, partial [Sinapis alba]